MNRTKRIFCSRLLLGVTLSAALSIFVFAGCATSIRPNEQHQLDELHSNGVKTTQTKNPWIAGFLGLASPACNLYLHWGTGRNEQLPMALVNLATWPFSVAWAIPGCVLDTKTVNELTTLEEHLDLQAQAQTSATPANSSGTSEPTGIDIAPRPAGSRITLPPASVLP